MIIPINMVKAQGEVSGAVKGIESAVPINLVGGLVEGGQGDE